MADSDASFNSQLQSARRASQRLRSLMKERNLILFQNRPQSWRHLLGVLSGVHFATLVSRLMASWMFWGLHFTRLNVLSAVAVAIAIATRFTWHALFVNPYAFLGYRRPSAAYRLAVYIVSFVTTVPALILHIAMISASAESWPSSIDFVKTIWQLVLLLPSMGLYIWMVRRFLLRHNDQHYEPTTPLCSPREHVQPGTAPACHHLSREYARQRARRPDRSGGSYSSQASEPTVVTETTTPTTASLSRVIGPPSPLRCQTIAWFDYKSHSWLEDPLIPLVLGVYATFIAYLVFLLAQENRLSKFRSPKATAAFYLPIGVYLLCAYAIKRFIRTSFFVWIRVVPPQPWILIQPLFGKLKFRNSEDRSFALTDPRFRVAPIECPNYISKYNATRSCCDEYWGHQGRKYKNDVRIRAVVNRILFLGLASFLIIKGFVSIHTYPLQLGEDLNGPDLTVPDLQRLLRINVLIGLLVRTTVYLALLVIMYILCSLFKLLSLWGEAIVKYVPTQELMEPDRQIQI